MSHVPDGGSRPSRRRLIPADAWTANEQSIALAVAALGLAVFTLFGVNRVGPAHIGPLTGLLLSVAAIVAALFHFRRFPASEQAYIATLGLTLGIVGAVTSLVVLVALLPCGSGCL